MAETSFRIVSMATSMERTKPLIDTAILHGADKHLCLWKMEYWDPTYIQKFAVMRQQLSLIPDPDAIVCFVDAYDVVVSAPPEEMLARFRSFDADLVIGAEMNCFPPMNEERYQDVPGSRYDPDHSSAHRYVNSGGYMGTRAAIQTFLDFFSEKEVIETCKNGGDQTILTEYYLRQHSSRIVLDREGKLFLNMHLVPWSDLKIKGGRIFNEGLGTWPCFVHFNGGTWQTQSRGNILPILVERMVASARENSQKDLADFSQIVTDTCVPKPQRYSAVTSLP